MIRVVQQQLMFICCSWWWKNLKRSSSKRVCHNAVCRFSPSKITFWKQVL